MPARPLTNCDSCLIINAVSRDRTLITCIMLANKVYFLCLDVELAKYLQQMAGEIMSILYSCDPSCASMATLYQPHVTYKHVAMEYKKLELKFTLLVHSSWMMETT